AAVGDDHAPGDVHARPFHQPEPDGVAHADVGEPGAARHRDAGDAGTQHLLHAARRLQGGEFRPRGALAFALAFDGGIAIRDVAVRVDQARQDPLAGGIDHLDLAAILELDVGGQRADAPDPVAGDDDRVVASGRLAGAVDQGAIADHQGLRGAHDATSVRQADRPSKLPPTRLGCKADAIALAPPRPWCPNMIDREGRMPWPTSNTIARRKTSATSSIWGTSMCASATSTWRRVITLPGSG